MQIQKGLVKYKDRTDIVCTYGLTDDGKQYYFLDENSIPNGNIIASTALVEAIDPVVVASSVGVIDREGNVVVPFANKSVKAIGNGLLLVERAKATTPSVIEAINLRSDPLAATKLVTTPATIKDNMNAKMGNEGRFVFNDQFSEATICDVNGNNLIDNDYYSFIGIKNNEALYFSKNTVDSPVIEFVLPTAGGVEVPLPSESGEKLDVNNTDVTQATIDGAMVGDITADSFGDITRGSEDKQVMVENNPVEEKTETVENTATEENKNSENENNGFSPVDVATDVSNNQVEATEETTSVEPENKEESVPEKAEVKIENEDALSEKEFDSYAPKEEAIELPISTPVNEEKHEEVKVEDKVELDKNNDLMAFDFKDNINYDTKEDVKEETPETELDNHLEKIENFKRDLLDVDLESDIFADSTLHADKIISDSFEDTNFKLPQKDTIIEDVAATLSNLIKLNKAQKEKIAAYEEKFEQIVATHKSVVEKARSQVREMDTLKTKVKNYETIVEKLENKIESLEDKVHNQDKLITSQSSELEALRPQVEGKRELARILADAQDLLEHAE